MDDTDSQGAKRPDEPSDEKAASDGSGEAQANQAAGGLREQIAALRKQVKDAQDTLRDHHRRQEGRSFKS